MTAFKKCEDRDSLIFRFFNPTENEQSTDISFLKNIKTAYLCNLNEERINELGVYENKIRMKVEKSKIITLEIIF